MKLLYNYLVCNRSNRVFKLQKYLDLASLKNEEVHEMFAIIKTGGKQYKVSEGDVIKVEKIEAEAGDKIEFDQVLMVAGDDVKVGSPVVEGAKVSAEVLDQKKDKKIVIFKFKAKKNYRKKKGHRQPYTLVKIEKIDA